jgi:hypothetical protein
MLDTNRRGDGATVISDRRSFCDVSSIFDRSLIRRRASIGLRPRGGPPLRRRAADR